MCSGKGTVYFIIGKFDFRRNFGFHGVVWLVYWHHRAIYSLRNSSESAVSAPMDPIDLRWKHRGSAC